MFCQLFYGIAIYHLIAMGVRVPQCRASTLQKINGKQMRMMERIYPTHRTQCSPLTRVWFNINLNCTLQTLQHLMMPVIDLLFGSNASIKKRNQIAAGKIKGKFIRISISRSVRLCCRHFKILLYKIIDNISLL